jgi:hypothetical protein
VNHRTWLARVPSSSSEQEEAASMPISAKYQSAEWRRALARPLAAVLGVLALALAACRSAPESSQRFVVLESSKFT